MSYARPASTSGRRRTPATVRALAGATRPIAIIGAGSRGEFRIEDQIGCAWVAKGLIDEGWIANDAATRSIVDRWAGEPATAAADSASVGYLRRTGQLDDYEFIVDHVDDVDLVCVVDGREVRPVAGRGPISPP